MRSGDTEAYLFSPAWSMRMAAGRSPLRRLTLLPPELNRPAWLVVTVCLLIPAVLGVRYAGRGRPGRLDTGIELLLKPFTADALGDKIRQMLGGAPAPAAEPVLE